MKPREIKERLRAAGFRPSKSLGQNFLLEPTLLSSIVSDAGVGPGHVVLEIGAGAGTLTRELARLAARVVTVEVDESVLPVVPRYLDGRAYTIFGGTSEVQRDIIAKVVIGR